MCIRSSHLSFLVTNNLYITTFTLRGFLSHLTVTLLSGHSATPRTGSFSMDLYRLVITPRAYDLCIGKDTIELTKTILGCSRDCHIFCYFI